MQTHVHLTIAIDQHRLWDSIRITLTNATDRVDWFEREVFQGQSHAIALQKALVELETALVKMKWLQPGVLESPTEESSSGWAQRVFGGRDRRLQPED